MQKIRLLDGSIHRVDSITQKNGNLEIVITDKTAEEAQAVFKNKPALASVTLLTGSGAESGCLNGYVCYSGLYMEGDAKTVTLTKETDRDSQRITQALADAVEAVTHAKQAAQEASAAGQMASNAEIKASEVQANLDMAIAELTMAMATGGGVTYDI